MAHIMYALFWKASQGVCAEQRGGGTQARVRPYILGPFWSHSMSLARAIPLLVCGPKLSRGSIFAIRFWNGTVSYAASKDLPVRDVRSHPCEWLKHGSELP